MKVCTSPHHELWQLNNTTVAIALVYVKRLVGFKKVLMAQSDMLLKVALQFTLFTTNCTLELRFFVTLERHVPPQTLLPTVHSVASFALKLRQGFFPGRRP